MKVIAETEEMKAIQYDIKQQNQTTKRKKDSKDTLDEGMT